MTTYLIDKDGHGDETLWRQENRRVEGCTCAAAALGGALGSGHESYCGWDEDDEPQPVIRRRDLSEAADLIWPLLVLMLCETDDSVDRMASALCDAEYGHGVWMSWQGGEGWRNLIENYRDRARDMLRSLREVSS